MRSEKRPEKKRPAKASHDEMRDSPRSEPSKVRGPGRDAAAAIENPHELLGLVAGEANAAMIVEAARARLARIREANGSEAAVKAFVIGQICRARAAMLRQARREGQGRRDGQGRPSGQGRRSAKNGGGVEPRDMASVLAAG